MSIQWWGILGLIGWAYLLSSIFYLCSKERILPLLVAILSCTGYYALSHSALHAQFKWLNILLSQDAHAAHTTIVLSGLICSLIFFDQKKKAGVTARFVQTGFFALSLFAAASALRPYFAISKIYATPSWCFYSASACVVFFAALYYVLDHKAWKKWTFLFEPAAINPLVCYLIPFIVEAIVGITGWHSPLHQLTGALGIMACVLYAGVIFTVLSVLNRFNFKMRF
jgi:predicted acyltransferase